LNISEAAAEKRIARAVERLREFFRRRGVAVSSVAALSAVLSAHSAEAAPAALKAAIAASTGSAAAAGMTGAGAAAASAGSIAKGTLITMASANAKSLVLTAVAALLLTGVGVIGIGRLMEPSKARRVAVTAPSGTPAVATTTTRAALPPLVIPAGVAPPAPVAVTFSQGTTFEILGITDEPGRPSRWWSAEGTPIAAPGPMPATPPPLPTDANQVEYHFAIRKTDRSDGGPGEQSWSIRMDRPSTVSMGLLDFENSSTTRPGGNIMNYVYTTTEPAAAQADLTFLLGAGPWTQTVRVDLRPGASTAPIPTSQTLFAFERIADGRNGAEATFHFSAEHEKLRRTVDETVVLIDASGTRFSYEGTRVPRIGRTVFLFPIPRAKAVALEYGYRPWQRRTLRNISLRPGRKSAVVAGQSPSPAR
jgi:hypothetical protein